MRLCALASFALCVLGGNSHPSMAQARQHEADKKKAMVAYNDCVRQAVLRLDDGRADAATVAKGVASDCHSDFLMLTAAWTLSSGVDMTNVFESRELPMAIEGVFSARAMLRELQRLRQHSP
jgi:hypothetical protein